MQFNNELSELDLASFTLNGWASTGTLDKIEVCSKPMLQVQSMEEVYKSIALPYFDFKQIMVELNVYVYDVQASELIIQIGSTQISHTITPPSTPYLECNGVSVYQMTLNDKFILQNPNFELRISFTHEVFGSPGYLGIRDLKLSTDAPTSISGCPFEIPILENDGSCTASCLSFGEQLGGHYLDKCQSPVDTTNVAELLIPSTDYLNVPLTLDLNYYNVNEHFIRYTVFDQIHDYETINDNVCQSSAVFDTNNYKIQMQVALYLADWQTISDASTANPYITFSIENQVLLYTKVCAHVYYDGTKFHTTTGVKMYSDTIELADSQIVQVQKMMITCETELDITQPSTQINYFLKHSLHVGTATYAFLNWHYYSSKGIAYCNTYATGIAYCISCDSPYWAYRGQCDNNCPPYTISNSNYRNCTDLTEIENELSIPTIAKNALGRYLMKISQNDIVIDDEYLPYITFPTGSTNKINTQDYTILPDLRLQGGYNSWGSGDYVFTFNSLMTHYQIRIFLSLYLIDNWKHDDEFKIYVDTILIDTVTIVGYTGQKLAGLVDVDDYLISLNYRIPHTSSDLIIKFNCRGSSGDPSKASCGFTNLYILLDQVITALCPVGKFYQFYTDTCEECVSSYDSSTQGCILFASKQICHYSCNTCTSDLNHCTSCNSAVNHRSPLATNCACNSGYTDIGVARCASTSNCHYSCNGLCMNQNDPNSCLSCPAYSTTHRIAGKASDCICAYGYQDNGTQICQPICHYTCTTCSLPMDANACSSCPNLIPSFRQLTNSDTQCACIDGLEDIGVANCQVISPCYGTCQRCSLASSSTSCVSCITNRELNGFNQCLCKPGYIEGTFPNCTLITPCHYTCQLCSTSNSKMDCVTCPSGSHRTLINGECPCQDGYQDIGSPTCQTIGPCDGTCQLCSDLFQPFACVTCITNRVLNAFNQCECKSGYVEGTYPNCDQISPCHHSCQLCSTINSNTDCLTCPTSSHRTLTSNQCPCDNGYEDNGTSICQQISPCHGTCSKCSLASSSTSCISCITNREFNSLNECVCKPGYTEGTFPNCVLVSPCHNSCYRCSTPNSNTACVSCSLAFHRQLSINSCVCVDGYQDVGTCEPIGPCDESCKLCSAPSSPNSCLSCIGNRILNASNQCVCPLGYTDEDVFPHCVKVTDCSYSCDFCFDVTYDSCLSCPPNSHRTLTNNNECVCVDGFQDVGNINCQIVGPCDDTCSGCTAPFSATDCVGCVTNRILNASNQCECKPGYTEGTYPECVYLTPCHYSCHLCSTINSSTACISCGPNTHRTLITNQCICDSGYVDIASNSVCQMKCHYSCDTCYQANSSTSCISCPAQVTSHRVQSGYQCPCDTNYKDIIDQVNCELDCHYSCKTCSEAQNANACSTCPGNRQKHQEKCLCEPGYVDIAGQQNCQISCHYSCLTCNIPNSSSGCLSCDSTYHRILQGNVCGCEVNYQEITNEVNCSPICHYSCQTCSIHSDPNGCISCPQNSNRIMGLNNNCICQAGYVDDLQEQSCQLICDNTCKSCNYSKDPRACLTCDIGKLRILDNQNRCVCQYGYQENYGNDKCIEICHYSCESCVEPFLYNKCLTCSNQSHRIKGNDHTCVCNNEYEDINNEQICQLRQCNDKLCSKCNQDQICLECKQIDKIYLQIDQCICQDGYYLYDNQLCVECSILCKTCQNVYNYCSSCQEIDQNRILINNECKCKNKYWSLNNLQIVCISCDIDNGWFDEQCIKNDCNDGYYTYGEQCDDNNDNPRDGCNNCIRQQGYTCINIILQPSICYKCNNNCKECYSNGYCILCEIGYQNISGQCIQCPNNCDICEQSKCLKCSIIPKYIQDTYNQNTQQYKDCLLCENIDGLYTLQNDCSSKCGDQIIAQYEQCDDGNTIDGDGCSSICIIEPGYLCQGQQCIPFYHPIPNIQQLDLANEYQNERQFNLTYNQQINSNLNITNSIKISIINQEYRLNQDYTYQLIDKSQKKDNDYITFELIIILNLINTLQDGELKIEFINPSQIIGITNLTQQIQILNQEITNYHKFEQQQLIENIGKINEVCLYSLASMVGVAVIFGGLDIFWNLLDLLQVISYIIYIDTRLPQNLASFLNLFEFAQLGFLGNVLKFQDFIQFTIDPIRLEDCQAKGVFSERHGSGLMLLNIASTVTAFLITFFIYLSSKLIVYIIGYNVNKVDFQNNKCGQFMQTILSSCFHYFIEYSQTYFWSILIRTHLSTAYDIAFSVFLQLQLTNLSSFTVYLSQIIAIIVLCFQILTIYQYIRKLNVIKADSNSKQYINQYGSALFDTLETKEIGKIKCYYNVFLLIKKQLYMLFLVLLTNQPQISTIAMTLLFLLNILFLLFTHPLDTYHEFYKQLQCELLMFVLHCQMCLLTLDDILNLFDENQRLSIGLISICQISLIIFLQLLFDIIQQIRLYRKQIEKLLDWIYNKCINQQNQQNLSSIYQSQ